MGLLSWVKEKCQNIKEGIKTVLHEVKVKTADAVNRLADRTKEWGGKVKEAINNAGTKIGIILTPKRPYVPTEQEKKKADECVSLINSTFRSGIRNTLMNQPPEKRLETFQEFTKQATQVLNLTNVKLELENLGASTMGGLNPETNVFTLNAAMIACDNPELMEEQVFTVIHELTHKRQFDAIRDSANGKPIDKYGYSERQIYEFARNWKCYIQPRENYEWYRKQPLENAAYGFEDMVKAKYYGINF